MRYATLKKNDIANAPGVCVSFYVQGCPHKCVGCFNPETWDFNGGKEFTPETLNEIISALTANGIQRNLCILGGEPLCQENLFLTTLVMREVKKVLPDTKIYIWTGYLFEDLKQKAAFTPNIDYVLKTADTLIDGPFIQELRDITLQMRGSSNQRIINLTEER